LSDTESQPSPGPKIIPRSGHAISRADISNSALKVLYRLDKAGYQAFIVGGGVRDLLLGLRPKDFDVATDARPEQVRQLFGNSRLIGRRFKLAHVRFGREVVEVVTFRGAATAEDAEHQQTDSGRILRDNVYGAIEADVWRRDFTVNALYYNIADFTVWDYTTGLADVASRTLRLIGEPETRYREDPVRMLRAVRFQAKLGFMLHEGTRAPIQRLAQLLDGIPPARLLDEFQKLFLAGFGQRAFELLLEHRLLEHLFPATAAFLAQEPDGMAARLVRAGLANTDRRVTEERAVTPMFLFAVLLFGPISAAAQRRFEAGSQAGQAIAEAVDEVVREQNRRIGIPKRYSIPMRELLALQPRFHRREGRRALGFLTHPRFRAAYDFLLLRVEAGGEDPAIGQWWTELQTLAPPEQLLRVGAGRESGEGGREPGAGRRRRRRGGRRRRTPTAES
jgi:poly(A) polymerase